MRGTEVEEIRARSKVVDDDFRKLAHYIGRLGATRSSANTVVRAVMKVPDLRNISGIRTVEAPESRDMTIDPEYMSPYEIVYPGASVEHFNEESGEQWLKRLLRAYPQAVWLNPLRQRGWHSSESIKMIQELMDDRMYPLTLDGLDSAMRELSK